jgi:DNA-binding response OmpR family regulator
MAEGLKTGKRIMIVDDDAVFLEEFQEVLSLNGYEVVITNEGSRALDIAKEINPDLIILDLNMPGKSGFTVADELRRISNCVNVPVIAMTGFYEDQYTLLMKMCGIKKCFRKPLDVFGVMSEIEKELSSKS